MKELNKKQKTAIILMQDVFTKLELNNKEVADIMTYCNSKEESFSLFQFITLKWLYDKEIENKVNQIRKE